jgi:hypothetical protein
MLAGCFVSLAHCGQNVTLELLEIAAQRVEDLILGLVERRVATAATASLERGAIAGRLHRHLWRTTDRWRSGRRRLFGSRRRCSRRRRHRRHTGRTARRRRAAAGTRAAWRPHTGRRTTQSAATPTGAAAATAHRRCERGRLGSRGTSSNLTHHATRWRSATTTAATTATATAATTTTRLGRSELRTTLIDSLGFLETALGEAGDRVEQRTTRATTATATTTTTTSGL